MKRTVLLLLLCGMLFAAEPAAAYMGPGAGLGMIGSLLAVVGVGLVALFGLLILPVRLLMKRFRKSPPAVRAEPH